LGRRIDGEFLGTAGGEVQTFLLEKSMGLSETQILKLCEGLGSMTQDAAEKMAAYIEKRTPWNQLFIAWHS
jgi:hypothetical protein